MTKLRFEELNLSEEILDAVKDMGFEEASPIQAAAIPLIMQGKDLVGQAQTGTGKTAAFGIPVIEKLDPNSKELQAIILCPTRELVIQVSEEFRKIMKYKENLFIVPVYGGQEIERQLRHLKKGAQVVIGTPGRTMDHMRRGSIKMDSVMTVVLDEADEMLDMGFREDMEFILKDTPKTRQTIMFSATMAEDILELTKKYQNDPVIVNVANKKQNMPKIQQIYFEVMDKNKPEVLARLIDLHNVKLALVFCNTKSQVDQLVEILKTRGYFADALHGDMSQNHRDRVMNGFRNGTIEILVATDVAGRGIDVNDVEAVFNYDLPRDDEDYIHRIGRTARAGKSGLAFTFVTGKQVYNLKRIERANGIQIHRQAVPTIDELEATRINSYAEKIKETVEAGHISKYVNNVEILMGEEYTSLDVAASLLKIIMEKENEGFDRTADFSLPAKEQRNDRNPGRRPERRSDRKDSFKKFDRPDGFERKAKNNDFSEGAKPFRKGKFDSDKKEDFENKSRRKDFDPKFKPFKSEKKKSDSFKGFSPIGEENDFNREDSPFKKFRDDKPFKKPGSGKNDSFKKSKSSKDKFDKFNKEGKKPVKKFGKSK